MFVSFDEALEEGTPKERSPLRFPSSLSHTSHPAVLAGMRGKNPKNVVFEFFRCAAAAILAAREAFLFLPAGLSLAIA